MRLKKRKYWLDGWIGSSYIELYLCWDLIFFPKNYTPSQHHNRLRTHDITTQKYQNLLISDAVGFGIEILPRGFGCWYTPKLFRLCISLWIIGFWFDFPHTIKPLKFGNNKLLSDTLIKK